MKVLVQKKDNPATIQIVTTFIIVVSAAFVWIGQDWITTIVCALFSFFCLLFCILESKKQTRRQRHSLLAIDGDFLIWTVSELAADPANPRKETRHSIPLTAIESLKVIVTKDGEGALDYNFAEVSIIDVSGKNHPLPESLAPGVYYKEIFTALKARTPHVKLQEKFP